MKKVILTLVIGLMTMIGFSQSTKKPYVETKSKIFKFICDSTGLKCRLEMLVGNTSVKQSESFKKNFDLDKVRKYMLESLIEYRAHFGVYTNLVEDKNMTYQSNIWAERLSYEFKHSTRDIRGNTSEVIGSDYFFIFFNIPDSFGDINKIIAESLFDSYTFSYSHHKILIDTAYTVWGFGIYIKDVDSMYTCFRGKPAN